MDGITTNPNIKFICRIKSVEAWRPPGNAGRSPRRGRSGRPGDRQQDHASGDANTETAVSFANCLNPLDSFDRPSDRTVDPESTRMFGDLLHALRVQGRRAGVDKQRAAVDGHERSAFPFARIVHGSCDHGFTGSGFSAE